MIYMTYTNYDTYKIQALIKVEKFELASMIAGYQINEYKEILWKKDFIKENDILQKIYIENGIYI